MSRRIFTVITVVTLAVILNPAPCAGKLPRGYSMLTIGAVLSGELTLERNRDASPLFSPPSGTYANERIQLSTGAGFGIEVIRPVMLGLMVELGGIGVTFDDWFSEPFESNIGFAVGSLTAKVNTVGSEQFGLRPGIGCGWIFANPIGLENESSYLATLRFSLDIYNHSRFPVGLELVILSPFETNNTTYDRIEFGPMLVIRGGLVY